MGGLPTGEYVLHSIIAMLFGGFVACYCIGGWERLERDTAWVYEPNVSWGVQALLALMAVGVLASGVADAAAAAKLGRGPR